MSIPSLRNFTILNNKGFTLIEVLVASVILFASIATVSMIYRGAYLSSDSAQKHVKITSVIPALLANIRNDIRAKGNSIEPQINSKGNIWDIQFQWQANLVEYKSAPNKLDVDTGDFITPPLKYKLWLIDLELKFKTTAKQYQFYELSWSDE